MSSFCRLVSATACACALAIPLAAQQQPVQVDGDEITIRGCVGPVDSSEAALGAPLVWTRGDIMLAHAHAEAGGPVGTTGVPGPFFYYLDDEEELTKHVGQLIEIKGELGDFEEGDVKISHDDGFTEIEVDIDGRREKTRVPSSWFRQPAGDDDDEKEFRIVGRRIDVEDVRIIGACPAR
jgi:hypothetical protein